jgi:argininosuccinate synthase
LYKGNIIPAGVESPYSLFSEELCTFGEDECIQPEGRRRLYQSVWTSHEGSGHHEKSQ